MSTSLLRQLPNALTIGNGLAGVGAVLLFFNALATNQFITGTQLAFALIALGVLCDTVDGPLARWLQVNNAMGAQLDSLCDGATFGVATALVLGASLWSWSPVLAFLLASWWLTAVLLRLARFNVETDTATAHLYFSGLCSPVAALFITAVLAASAGSVAFPWVPLACALLLPALMLSRLVFADLPKHYLAKRRSPLELVITALAMLVVSPAIAVSGFLSYFVLQSLLANLRGKAHA